jgi:D-hexose-6-phosphate mutarotase
MQSAAIPDRLKRLEIPGRVTVLEGNGELPKLEVHSDHATAEIYLHGAQITDFKTTDSKPVLFTSKFSRFETKQPIRGGIPIIFPWFGSREGEPMHGFARTSNWELHEATNLPEDGVTLRFSLPETAESGIWPAFTANYIVTVTDQLRLELLVTNISPENDFTFENCLHTYLAVGDVNTITIGGLKDLQFLDKADKFAHKLETSNAVKITSEVDRIYLDAPGPVTIQDPAWNRSITLKKTGSASTVLWNPWKTKSQQIPDFGTDEYLRMICVESGNVDRSKLTLKPGQTSRLGLEISVAPLA